MREIAAVTLMLAGAAVSLVAAVGLHRFSDAYQRLHAAGMAGTLGLALVLIAALLVHGTSVGAEIFTLLFVMLTSPVGTHMMTKAMYETDHHPWDEDKRGRRPRSKRSRR